MKSFAIKMSQLVTIGLLLLTSTCHASGEFTKEINNVNESSQVSLKQTADCPLISSKNWSAELRQSDDKERLILSISGDIELPNPGYSIVLKPGAATRSLPPSQHFNIQTERLDGFYIQAVTPMTLKHSSDAMANQYHSIIIHCGAQVIATIDDVSME